jgi:N-acetylmuramoyl-L-alanine amidase
MMPLLSGGVLLYAAKTIVVSAVLFGYYWLLLRNKGFHRYNRVYLLSAALLAVTVPLMPLPGLSFWKGVDEAPVLSGVLHAAVAGSWTEGAPRGGLGVAVVGGIGSSWWVYGVYGLVVVVSGAVFLWQLAFVLRLYRKYPRERMGDVLFLMTREPGTPFSFLRTIFWDEGLAVDSARGRQILRHELVHVRQWHTLDLLFLRGLLLVFWFNPFFYFIYRELRTLHEFEADAQVVSDGDRFAYAELLVWQMMGAGSSSLFHSFFSSSIKRRITMITQFPSAAAGRGARLMALPLLLLLFCGFSHRVERAGPAGRVERAGRADKPYTVIIDAGHGGADAGAVAANGVKESMINLSLARKVKALAAEYGVKVILTRDGDELAGGMKSRQASLHYRADLAGAQKADLFISLHTDAASGAAGDGFHIYVSKENAQFAQSARLGGVLIDALKSSYATGQDLVEPDRGIYVLKAATVPAVLILCGNIDNERDRAFISDGANQEKIARDLLQGIVRYEQTKS